MDMFGEAVEFTFQKKKRYQTVYGALISIACTILMTSFFIVRTLKLISKDDPFFSMTTMALES